MRERLNGCGSTDAPIVERAHRLGRGIQDVGGFSNCTNETNCSATGATSLEKPWR